MPYAATLDANILHPHITADLLLRLAEHGLFRIVWSAEILAEVHDSLVRRGLDAQRIGRRVQMMRHAFPEADIGDIAPFLGGVPSEVENEDRHVVAAALAGKADAVVTNNHALLEMEADRDQPPRTLPELLAALEPHAPEFVHAVRAAAA